MNQSATPNFWPSCCFRVSAGLNRDQFNSRDFGEKSGALPPKEVLPSKQVFKPLPTGASTRRQANVRGDSRHVRTDINLSCMAAVHFGRTNYLVAGGGPHE